MLFNKHRIATSSSDDLPLLISNNQYPISNDQICYLHLDIDDSLLDIGYSPSFLPISL